MPCVLYFWRSKLKLTPFSNHKPPTAPPNAILAPPKTTLAQTAPKLHLSRTVLRKVSRSATKEGNFEKMSNFLLDGKVGFWKQARELVIISEPNRQATSYSFRQSYQK
jgi:hypothetical protein